MSRQPQKDRNKARCRVLPRIAMEYFTGRILHRYCPLSAFPNLMGILPGMGRWRDGYPYGMGLWKTNTEFCIARDGRHGYNWTLFPTICTMVTPHAIGDTETMWWAVIPRFCIYLAKLLPTCKVAKSSTTCGNRPGE